MPNAYSNGYASGGYSATTSPTGSGSHYKPPSTALAISMAVLIALGLWRLTSSILLPTGLTLPRRLSRSDKGKKKVPGLYNLGNTCFANSVLQALVSCPSLFAYLRRRHAILLALEETDAGQQHLTRQRNTREILDAFLSLALELNQLGNSPRPLSPKRILNALAFQKGTRHLLGYEQQDAHEFLQSLSSRLRVETALSQSSNGGLALLTKLIMTNASEFKDSIDAIKFNMPKLYYQGRIWNNSEGTKQDLDPLTGLTAHRVSCLVCGFKVINLVDPLEQAGS